MENERQNLPSAPSTSAIDASSSSDGLDTHQDDDFKSLSSSSVISPKRQRTKTVVTSDVAVDRVQMTDRGVTIVTAAVVQTLGHDLYEASQPRNTIRRARGAARNSVAGAV